MGRKKKSEPKPEVILEPCPFCGGRAEEYYSLENVPLSLPAGVKCIDCDARRDTVREWNQRADYPRILRTMYELGYQKGLKKAGDQ